MHGLSRRFYLNENDDIYICEVHYIRRIRNTGYLTQTMDTHFKTKMLKKKHVSNGRTDFLNLVGLVARWVSSYLHSNS